MAVFTVCITNKWCVQKLIFLNWIDPEKTYILLKQIQFFRIRGQRYFLLFLIWIILGPYTTSMITFPSFNALIPLFFSLVFCFYRAFFANPFTTSSAFQIRWLSTSIVAAIILPIVKQLWNSIIYTVKNFTSQWMVFGSLVHTTILFTLSSGLWVSPRR